MSPPRLERLQLYGCFGWWLHRPMPRAYGLDVGGTHTQDQSRVLTETPEHKRRHRSREVEVEPPRLARKPRGRRHPSPRRCAMPDEHLRRRPTNIYLNADIGMKPCRIGPSVVHSLSATDNTDTGVLQRLTRILTTLGPLSGHLTPARRRPLIGCRRAVERGR